jgi:hypothetical protein
MGGACSTDEEMRFAYEILVGKPIGGNNSEELNVNGRIILKQFLRK